ncbi:MAG TPA: ATP-grasp domain-containing protein [Mobilitalea sp.]|nr:ATP-grasp domain-containing protein [Mobilitalea sp.]
MNAWLLYFKESAIYNQKYIEFYIEEGKKLGITIKLVLIEELDFGIYQDEWYLTIMGETPRYPDFVICRAIYPLLSKQLELMGIRVFNSSFVSEICNDKAKTYQFLAKSGIKMIDSNFYLNSQLKEVLKNVKQPTVIKAVEGHGGSQVFLVETSLNDEIIKGIGNSNVVVQPLIGNKYQDLRVYVIGKEIIAAVLRTAKEGFKANFSLGGEVSLYHLSEEEQRLVYKITNQFDFGLVGIDFIINDQNELIFNEIEDVVGSRMLYKCSDINIVDLYLKHICDLM